MGELGGLTALAIVVFLVILSIVWILLPFAIFGTKPLLRQIASEAQRTNELLDRLSQGGELHRALGQLGGESVSSEQRLYPPETVNKS